MKIEIEPTQQFVEVIGPGGSVMARVWQGTVKDGEAGGLPVQLLVTRVAAAAEADQAELAHHLREIAAPLPVPSIPAFPLRMVI